MLNVIKLRSTSVLSVSSRLITRLYFKISVFVSQTLISFFKFEKWISWIIEKLNFFFELGPMRILRLLWPKQDSKLVYTEKIQIDLMRDRMHETLITNFQSNTQHKILLHSNFNVKRSVCLAGCERIRQLITL